MKKVSTVFLKCMICFIALFVLAGMLWFPQMEGRATNLDLINIYSDPLIIYVYIGSIPFFIGLYQAFKLLRLIDSQKAFSKEAVNTLKSMKFASLSMIGFIALAIAYIHLFIQGEDPAGPTMLGICLIVLFMVTATALGIVQNLFQKGIDLKSENDLTV